jgi:Ca-activated chloride channel family protein
VTPTSFPVLAAAGTVLAVSVAIILLHLLRPRAVQKVLASTLLWSRVLRGPRRPVPRWRWWLSLLLALAISLSLALAALAPDLASIGLQRQPLVIVLDDAPSMAARLPDGDTRWQRAASLARALIDASGPGREVILLDTMQRAPVAGPLPPHRAIESLLQLSPAPFGQPRLPPTALDPAFDVHVFTDGVALAAPPVHAVEHSVFSPVGNAGILAFEARTVPGAPTRVEALVQLFNASPAAKRVSLSVRGDGGFAIVHDVELGARESLDLTFDVSGYAGGVLGAAVSAAGDGFASDDLAFAFVPQHRPTRVLLVTPGNTALHDALRSLPGVIVSISTPDAYRPASAADVYVFDRFAPDRPPAGPAMLFRPPQVPWMTAPGHTRRAAVVGWDEGHPAMRGSRWDTLQVRRASPAEPGEGIALVTSSAGPLVSARNRDSRRLRVGFALHESNLALQPWFPVFLGSAIAWLSQGTNVLSHPLGAVEIAARDARVRDGSGAPVPTTATATGTRFDAARPDVYSAEAAEQSFKVVANVLDPRFSDINASRLTVAEEPAAPTALRLARLDTWRLLLLVALGLLAIEWFAYTRRFTA